MKSKEGLTLKAVRKSLPVRGAWVEILQLKPCVRRNPSLPVRGAWVEMVIVRF